MGSANVKRGSEVPVPGGAKLQYEGTLLQEAVGALEVARFILEVGREVGVGVLSTWLYEKLKAGNARTVRIEGVETELTQAAIERFFVERLRPRGPYAYE